MRAAIAHIARKEQDEAKIGQLEVELAETRAELAELKARMDKMAEWAKSLGKGNGS